MSEAVKIKIGGDEVVVTVEQLAEYDETGVEYEIVSKEVELDDVIVNESIPEESEQPNDGQDIPEDVKKAIGDIATDGIPADVIVDNLSKVAELEDEVDRLKLAAITDAEILTDVRQKLDETLAKLSEAESNIELSQVEVSQYQAQNKELVDEIQGNRSEIATAEKLAGKGEDFKIENQELKEQIKFLQAEALKLNGRLIEEAGINRNAKDYNEFLMDKENCKEFEKVVKSLGWDIDTITSDKKQKAVNVILKKRGV